jgi:hypothetical protein
MVTRDHMDLGSSVCMLGGVGAAHYFHSRNPDPDPEFRGRTTVPEPMTTGRGSTWCERFFENSNAYAAQLRSLLTENFQIIGV